MSASITNVAVATVVITSLAYVAGLGWNGAFQALIEKLWKGEKDTIIAKFAYAIIITIVILFMTKAILKLLTRPELQKYVD